MDVHNRLRVGTVQGRIYVGSQRTALITLKSYILIQLYVGWATDEVTIRFTYWDLDLLCESFFIFLGIDF